jgi:hypothetical protein
VLEVHLGEGDDVNPDAWRAAQRIFEHAFGRPRELPEETEPQQTLDARAMTPEQRQAAIAEMLGEASGAGGARSA